MLAKIKPDYVVGIDPGVQGGVAVISRDHRHVEVHKLSDKTVFDIAKMFTTLGLFGRCAAFIEGVNSHPGEGVSSAHKFGKSVGRLEMAALANDMTLDYVQPQVWQRMMALGVVSGNRKNAHAKKAAILFPGLDRKCYYRGNVILELCDALLIAEYGWRQTFID